MTKRPLGTSSFGVLGALRDWKPLRLALTELGLNTQVIISPLSPSGGLDSAARYGIAWLKRTHLASPSDVLLAR
ncbi:hypothetical protein [Deinococcus apachensis]|uniref:hypothetical protein n=1 Tax=Deinococcus apachensis TaxID=309886 RepID=UPI000381F199|nr:hypothetical protein [Deinococcus apachensis]